MATTRPRFCVWATARFDCPNFFSLPRRQTASAKSRQNNGGP
jgi:hypothetical protein